MKWFAAVLLLMIAALWFYGDTAAPSRVAVVSERQALPRVADLRPSDVAVGEGEEDPGDRRGPPAQEVIVIDTVSSSQYTNPRTVCVRLGWFGSPDDAAAAWESLDPGGSDFQIREEERELSPLHWVIIPPQPENRALELFQDLQRRGIDSYLIRQGENRNAISLGLFESRAAAENVLVEKKRQNLNAVLATFPRNQISYALVFEDRLPPEPGAIEAAEADYSENFELAEIRRCESIATGSENP